MEEDSIIVMNVDDDDNDEGDDKINTSLTLKEVVEEE